MTDPVAATFRTSNINHARLLWDPSVHQLFAEECRYILLRFHQPQPEMGGGIVADLQRTLERALIESHNIYLIYGYWDVLIRVWTTNQKWQRLMRLMNYYYDIDAHKEYHVDHVDYFWTRHLNRTAKPDRYRQAIQEVSAKERQNDDMSIDDPTLSELLKAGILHHLDEEPRSSIKFYILLSSAPPWSPTAKEYAAHLRNLLIGEGLPYVRKVSLYQCNGGSDYFLKFVVSEYDEILSVVSTVTREAKGSSIRTMTLLISNVNAPEADVVDPNWDDFPQLLFELEELLGKSSSFIAKTLARLDAQTRLDLAKTFARYRSLLTSQTFKPIFEGFFLALAEHDIQMLSEKLNWITHLESLLRSFFREFTQKQLGSDWYGAVRAAAKQVGVSEERQPQQYSLRETLNILSKLVAAGTLRAADVEEQLGRDWEDRIRGLTETFAGRLEIRNNLAHGSLYDQETEYWEHWTEVAERVFGAAEVYVRLRARAEQQEIERSGSDLGA